MFNRVIDCVAFCVRAFGMVPNLKQICMICLFGLFPIMSYADISANNTTPVCGSEALNTDSGTADLEINWEPNVIPLHWYNGNTEITPTNTAATSCVYDSGLVIPENPPEREGYTFEGWRVRDVPYGYTRLKYLGFNSPYGFSGSDATHINTGIILTNNHKIKVRVNGQNFVGVMGRWNGNNSFQIYNQFFRFGTNNLNNDLSQYLNTDVTLAYGQDGLYVNDTLVATPSAVTFTTPATCLIGSVGTTDSRFEGKIYEAWIYYQETPVGHYIPAYRNSDNVLGMWDTVGKTFLTNQGSGAFSAGPVAQ